ncbi:MarR family winged helix-turn-helix transcriptional regulator [Raineyella fluvialis]|uniref:MarR family transcriptional regulator n=1 Tax=Raineyella fluvialis TaxID=2662261 RepID=A0A5Q2F6C3_9ACTN|nr:MarR family transcriptional regulator [Raineyella fluvialis]QGF22379.1 MarR family transcriptional regulator [Raineyella fluvialis]
MTASPLTDCPPRWLDEQQQQIWRNYLRGVHRLDEYLDRALRPFDLSLAEYEILVSLSEAEDHRMRMSDLADAVHQSRSRLTHTVSRMESAGLIERLACPSDRRGVWAQLSSRGYDLLVEAAPCHVASVRRALVDAADPDDYEALGRVFAAVLAVPDITPTRGKQV